MARWSREFTFAVSNMTLAQLMIVSIDNSAAPSYTSFNFNKAFYALFESIERVNSTTLINFGLILTKIVRNE